MGQRDAGATRQPAHYTYWRNALERAGGFNRTELNSIMKLAQEHRARLLRSWYEFFSS